MRRRIAYGEVIACKFDFEVRGWISKGGRDAYGVGVWKAIRKGWTIFANHVRFEFGEGTRIEFWHDLWCRDVPLSIAFLGLFSIATNKSSLVADYINNSTCGSGGAGFLLVSA